MNREAVRAKLLALCAIARRKQPLMSLSELVDQTADQLLALPVGGGVEGADLKWLLRLVERQAYTGHCGEENSEIRARRDNDERIARILAALSPTTLGGE